MTFGKVNDVVLWCIHNHRLMIRNPRTTLNRSRQVYAHALIALLRMCNQLERFSVLFLCEIDGQFCDVFFHIIFLYSLFLSLLLFWCRIRTRNAFQLQTKADITLMWLFCLNYYGWSVIFKLILKGQSRTCKRKR